MSLKRVTTLRIVVACMVMALAGLIAVQWYLLRQAMELKEQAFRRNVLSALNTVAQKMEAGEAYGSVMSTFLHAPPGTVNGTVNSQITMRRMPLPDSLRIAAQIQSMPLRADGNRVTYTVVAPQRVRIQRYDIGAGRDTTIVDTFKTPGVYEVHAGGSKKGGEYFYRYSTDSTRFYLRYGMSDTRTVSSSGAEKRALVNRVVDQLIIAEAEPVERRVKSTQLDSLLGSSLHEAGISLNYARGVFTPHDSSLKLVQPLADSAQLRTSDLRARLFPTDFLSPRSDLVIFFPGQQTFLLGQIGPLLAATALFTLLILVVFIYAVRTIMAQTRLTRLMTDFINNMTHEFKTPISTVSLAVEAIDRPDVMEEPGKVRRYNSVIREENSRMRAQVEKILQMAVLERGEYELNMHPVDAHELIRHAASGVALQAEHRGGKLELCLDAARHQVKADSVHLANIVNNLLDNANKYSPENPAITVSTRNSDRCLVIRVQDNGIGIGTEHLSRVFEKFYRVPTGNRHDVKGFGLGLSYVKLMTEAMGGTVRIDSRVGEGTTVEVMIPESAE